MKTFTFERNFLILLAGGLTNGIGNGIYLVAGMLLVLQISGSVLYTGFAAFAISSTGTLAFLIAPLANYTKYKNGLIYSNLIKSLLLFTIPILHYTIGLNIWYVILLLFITGLFTQYTYPIESTILPIIVGKDNVVQANAYLQTIREAMDIVFIAGAGIIITFMGPVHALLITAVCIFLVSILYTGFNFQQPTLSAKETQQEQEIATQTYWNDLKSGIQYIQHSFIPKMMISITILNLAMAIMTTNLPAFSLMKGNGLEASYGFYLAAVSLGIMIGSLISPMLKTIDFGKLMIVATLTTGAFWIGTALLPFYLSIITFSLGAISLGVLNLLIFSSIQKQVDVQYIGRVITVITSMASLGIPIGSLLGGFIGESFTPTIAVITCSIAMFLFSSYWLTHPILRKLPSIEQMNLFYKRGVDL